MNRETDERELVTRGWPAANAPHLGHRRGLPGTSNMSESSHLFEDFVQPVHPAAAYIGGKRRLARSITRAIDRIPHASYAEVFVGMGGVFLRRSRRPPVEVINDWSEDVSTFFRILQRHYVAFLDMLRFQLTTRSGFERLLKVDPSTQTDLERAARFLVPAAPRVRRESDCPKLWSEPRRKLGLRRDEAGATT